MDTQKMMIMGMSMGKKFTGWLPTIFHNSKLLKVPEKLQLYGLYVYYVVHICDFGMLRVNEYSH